MSPVGRRAGRRQALFLLYQWDLTGQPLASLYEGEPDEFAAGLAEAAAARAPELDRRITTTSDEWPADRLGTLERNILRIGVYELEEGTVPREIAINEAVVLAKRYASEDAARLVNGISAESRATRRLRDAGGRSPRPCRGAFPARRAAPGTERLAAADEVDGNAAVDVIGELAEIAKEIESELELARGRSPMQTPDELREAIEAYLAEIELASELGRLEDAIRYAPDPGGKRIRPVLCLAVAESAGGESSRRRLRPPPSSSCTRSRSSTTTSRPSTTTTSDEAAPAPTSRSAKAPRCSPGTRSSPRRSASRSPTRTPARAGARGRDARHDRRPVPRRDRRAREPRRAACPQDRWRLRRRGRPRPAGGEGRGRRAGHGAPSATSSASCSRSSTTSSTRTESWRASGISRAGARGGRRRPRPRPLSAVPGDTSVLSSTGWPSGRASPLEGRQLRRLHDLTPQ